MAEPNNMPGCDDGDHSNNKLYKGVRKRKWGKWVSEVRLPNSRERIWLGSYDSPIKAARAFDAALYCLRGCRANFNFPDTPLNLEDINIDQSFTAQEIQVIAAKFANECPNIINQEQQHGGANNKDDSAIGLFDESTKAKSDSVMTETVTTTTYPASSSTSNSSTITMHECNGRVQVDHGDMDWTFLNELGDSSVSVGSYHYDLYSDLDKLHPGEFLMYSTTIPPPPPPSNFEDEIEDHDDDPFSHQPFLWNW